MKSSDNQSGQPDVVTWLVIFALIAPTYFDHFWVWGCLFCFWAVKGIQSGDAFLISNISVRESPLPYWAVTLMWSVFGLWYLIGDTLWRFGILQLFGVSIYGSV